MKVHFAGYDPFTAVDHLRLAGVRYLLQTFHAIHTKKQHNKIPYDKLTGFKHIIIDSGLFTIMFGSEAGAIFGPKEAQAWLDAYITWANGTQFKNVTFVECDVQKKLGADAAWEMRREMKKRLKVGGIMNVYHLEDENPDKLIAYSDYIGVGLPELRACVTKKERHHIVKYISTKASAKGKKVHLLGCTDKSMMREFSFNYSCDSTSWISGLRYGHLKSDILPSSRIEEVAKLAGSKYSGIVDRGKYASAAIKLMEYSIQAGDQT